MIQLTLGNITVHYSADVISKIIYVIYIAKVSIKFLLDVRPLFFFILFWHFDFIRILRYWRRYAIANEIISPFNPGPRVSRVSFPESRAEFFT